ncbi:MAG: hypothetical protein QOD26_3996 [Betaproteobacteria bacterium]|nr:hypothetical protein [Betaproteobacteria bacterium]
MAKTPAEQSERFIKHFRGVYAEIQTLESQRAPLYREVLYVAVLDALSKSVMPHRESNRDRFVSFLKRFCRWPDGERVSLPHLFALLTLNPDPAFEKLRLWTVETYKKMSVHGGAIMAIGEDPTYEDVKDKWPVSNQHRMPIKDVDLDALTHYRLLYLYRNMLVHELRRPGKGMDFVGTSDAPYYHGARDLDDNWQVASITVELVYPWRFLDRLCSTALDELADYFKTNNLNPYESFVFGSHWLRELNR